MFMCVASDGQVVDKKPTTLHDNGELCPGTS